MRKLTAFLAICGVALSSTAISAGGSSRNAGSDVSNDALSRRSPEVRGFVFRPGGHRYDFEYEPFLRRNGPYGNYPQFDPRSFRERTLSDPRIGTTSPSAF